MKQKEVNALRINTFALQNFDGLRLKFCYLLLFWWQKSNQKSQRQKGVSACIFYENKRETVATSRRFFLRKKATALALLGWSSLRDIRWFWRRTPQTLSDKLICLLNS